MSLLVSAARCCAGMRAAKEKPNDSKRDGVGLLTEFYGICVRAVVELYGVFSYGKKFSYWLSQFGANGLGEGVRWDGCVFFCKCVMPSTSFPALQHHTCNSGLSKQP